MSFPTILDEPAALNHVVINQSINDYDESSSLAEAVIDASSAAASVTTNNHLNNELSINQYDDTFVETDQLTNSTNHPLHIKLKRDILTIQRINETHTQSNKSSLKSANKQPINQFNVHDLLGCTLDGLSLTLHLYVRKSSKHARTHHTIDLKSTDQSVATLWHCYFTRAARSLPLINQPVPNRSIKLIVNPSSGTGNAASKAQSIVPLIQQAGIHHTIETTNRSGHAYDIANKLPIDPSINQSIVCVSGDGLLYEIINGLMHRDDWLTAIHSLTIGVIAGGGGNGFARSVCHVSDEVFDAVAQAFLIVKGYTRKLDLASIHKPVNQSSSQSVDRPIFSMLSLAWAMISDIDLKSDKYRWMGGARFTAAAVSIILANKPHTADIEYLPAHVQTINRSVKRSLSQSSDRITTLPDVKPCTEQTRCEHCWKHANDSEIDALQEFLKSTSANQSSTQSTDQSLNQSIKQSVGQSDQWHSLPSSPVRVLWGMNVPYAATDMLPAPLAHMSDGALDLLIVRSCGRFALIDVMTSIESGTHLKLESAEYIKVRGLKVTPHSACPYSVDGEAVKSAPIELKMWRAILNVHSK